MELGKAQLSQRGRGETSNPGVCWQGTFGIKPESAWLNHGQLSPTLNPNLSPRDRISTVCIIIKKAQDEPLALKMHMGWFLSLVSANVWETWAIIYEA